MTNSHELFADTPDVEAVLTALAEARIVHVGVLDPEEYESGTSEKWVVTLEGGQRAMMKLHWSVSDRLLPHWLMVNCTMVQFVVCKLNQFVAVCTMRKFVQ